MWLERGGLALSNCYVSFVSRGSLKAYSHLSASVLQILACIFEHACAPDSRLVASGRLVLFCTSLSRGQVLPAHTLLNTVDVELIYEGRKYVLKVRCPVWKPILLSLLIGNVFLCAAPA